MSGSTLNDFFGISVKGFRDDILGKLQSGGSLSELKGRVIGQMTPEHWPNVASGLGDKVSELFDVDVAHSALRLGCPHGRSGHPPHQTV